MGIEHAHLRAWDGSTWIAVGIDPATGALKVYVVNPSGGEGGGLTDAQLRATPVPVSATDLDIRNLSSGQDSVNVGNFPATQTVAGSVALDAATLAALETISVANFPAVQPVSDNGGSLTVDGPVTDAQLRASAVPVSGPLTDAQLRATAVPVSGPLTDAQLRASAVKAREDTAVMTWVSLKSAAPAANAVQADTGALAAGDYDFDIYLSSSDTVAVGKGLVVEHRNAANGATTHNLGSVPAGVALKIELRRYTLALNERIRVIAGTAAGAASSMYVSSIGRRIA